MMYYIFSGVFVDKNVMVILINIVLLVDMMYKLEIRVIDFVGNVVITIGRIFVV